MYIQSISVKGYRNFHNVNITFHKGLNVIIGSNNSGKTNLLNIIRMIKQQEKLTFFDFNMNTLQQSYLNGDYKKEPLSIELIFDIYHEINLAEEPTDESLLKLSDFLCLTDEIVYNHTAKSFPVKASVKMIYQLDGKQLSDYRLKVESLYSFKEYIAYFKTIISEYKWNFYNASTLRSVDSAVAKGIFEIEYVQADRSNIILQDSTANLYKIILNKTPLDKDSIIHSIEKLIGTQAAVVFAEISAAINKNYTDIGINKGNVKIKPIVEFSHNINQFLGFGVSDTCGSFELPFENNGLGYNNLIAIYLILLCRESVNPQIHSMVLLEEPEAHLHPAMQYKLFKYINNLQDRDKLRQQIFVTTHSPNITAVTNIDSIIDLHYDRESTPNNINSINFINLFNDQNSASKKHIRKFLDVTRSDMLFADSVVLVEGLTEKLLLPVFLNKEGFDIDDNHVSVVEIGGKWIKHFLYLFDQGRKTKVICITDCDYKWIVSDEINTTDYATYKANHVAELKNMVKNNPYINIYCQCGSDGGSTFEDQLVLDNWSISEKMRKRLFSFVFPDVLNEFLELNPLTLPKWKKNIKNIRKDTRESVSKVLLPFYDKYISTSNRKEKKKWTALFFATLFKKYAVPQKGNLALAILTDEELCASIKTPRYIKEGIDWLKS